MRFLMLMTTLFLGVVLHAQVPIIHSSTELIDIKDGEVYKKDYWHLNPDLKPDVFETQLSGDSKVVTFITDQDSIEITVNEGSSFDFIILLNGKDTCYQRVRGTRPFNFSPTYVKQHSGQVSFEYHEVHELIHVICALTELGRSGEIDMIDTTSSYYQEVIRYFEPFKTDEFILQLDAILKDQYMFYFGMKMDAAGFYFDSNDHLVKDSNYLNLTGEADLNCIELFISELQRFSDESKFREFYKNHKPFYKSMIRKMKYQAPVKAQWEWLETQFTEVSYQHYRIIFSVLTGGGHSTNNFDQDDFKQMVMFINAPSTEKPKDDLEAVGEMSRIIFTEIDHNYINPLSDKYLEDIEEAMPSIERWASDDLLEYYTDSYAVFNEFMTFSTFSAYLMDHYSTDEFEQINKLMLDVFGVRGFKHFEAFNTYFLEIYAGRNKGETLTSLYPLFIDWFKNKQSR